MAEEIQPVLRSWNLRHIKDTRENVIQKVAGAATVPDAMKAMLTEAIESLDPKINLVKLDAHAHFEKGLLMINATIAPI